MGLKLFTKPGSDQVKLTKGGNKYIPDNSKPNRKYKTKGDK